MTGCSLVAVTPSEQGAARECPAALLGGVLAQGDDGAAVVHWENGEQRVKWPEGYVVEQGPIVRLRDEAGNVVASEGESIYVGGGFTMGDELFIACGYVSSDPP
jgi:hypothetical protein